MKIDKKCLGTSNILEKRRFVFRLLPMNLFIAHVHVYEADDEFVESVWSRVRNKSPVRRQLRESVREIHSEVSDWLIV